MPENSQPSAAAVRAWYEAAQWRFRAFEAAAVAHLNRLFAGAELENLQVESRTKSLDSFVKKAMTPDPSSPGSLKYAHPESEITDAVGVRIIVPLSTDVAPVRSLLHERFVVEEETDRGADEHLDVPGYQSLHLLLRLREQDRLDPAFRGMDDILFEVQVRTILQHAWASLQHDLMYKADRPPAPATRRRLVALAGLLELADREFVQVRHEHGDASLVGRSSLSMKSDDLTPGSVRQLVDILVGLDDTSDQAWFQNLHAVIDELGFKNRQAVLDALGPWKDRGAEVASAATAARPYVNAAFVFDQMLRLALGERYFERRARHAELSSEDDARRTFMRERAALLGALDAG